jgi:hypothetical protein
MTTRKTIRSILLLLLGLAMGILWLLVPSKRDSLAVEDETPAVAGQSEQKRTKEPRLALPFGLQDGGSDSLEARVASLQDWTEESPDAAFEWSVSQIKDGHFDSLQSAVLLAIADHWPERLGEFLDRVASWQYSGEYDEREAMAGVRTRFQVDNLARILIDQRTECGELADWIAALPAGSEERIRLSAALARQWAVAIDAGEAMAWLNRDGEKPMPSTVDFVLDRWIRSEPAKAAEWAASKIARGDLAAASMGTAIFRWGQMDTEAAAAWMSEKVEAGPVWLDEALGAFVTATAKDAPADAIEWISYIEDADVRRKVLQRMPKWTGDNKAAWDAAALLHIANLADEGATPAMLQEWISTLHSQAARAKLEAK